MPRLEFQYGDPNPEIWGAMLFPDLPEKRSAYVAHLRERYFLDHFGSERPTLVYEVHRDFRAAKWLDPEEIKRRHKEGRIAGELLKLVFLISADDPAHASWRSAIRLLEREVDERDRTIRKAKEKYRSVVHLWAAWLLRDEKFYKSELLGFRYSDDLQMFLCEAMALLRWAQRFVPTKSDGSARVGAEPILDPNLELFWIPPRKWKPPVPQPSWPRDGRLPEVRLPDEWLKFVGAKPLPRRKKSAAR
jgi:hypothetical protein